MQKARGGCHGPFVIDEAREEEGFVWSHPSGRRRRGRKPGNYLP
jgi:hypothetical protein